jgi:hypothetical protein
VTTAEITDDDILATADQLITELALTEDDRDVIVLRLQRLVWPPSPHYFLHGQPHVMVEIGQHDGGGWFGELLCPSGCSRRWLVSRGPSEEAVHGALTQAHTEYQTGKTTAVPAPGTGHRVTLDALLNRSEYVEVTDERMVGR